MFMELNTKFPNVNGKKETDMIGYVLNIPQQPMFSDDCGIFLLEYVEQFFKNPIEVLHPPFKSFLDWFDVDHVVATKKKNISEIIKNIMVLQGRNQNLIPEIEF